MDVYVNAAGHQEEVSDLTWLWALIFGLFYFMVKGVWKHVAIQIVAIIVLLAAFGEPGIMFVFLMWVGYAICAREIVTNMLGKQGYRLSAPAGPPAFNPDGLTHAKPPTPPKPSDEAYAAALAECESQARNAGLWARVFAQANGDEGKAKAAYVNERVKQLAQTAPKSGGLGSSSPVPQKPPA